MSRQLLGALGLVLVLGSAGASADEKSGEEKEPAVAGRPIKSWLKDLDDEDLLVREEAVEVLASLGPRAKDAGPALKKLLGHENRSLRARAALALWKIDGEAKPIAKVLGESLKQAGALIRRESAMALGQMGPEAAPASAALIDLLDDSDYLTTNHALNALARIGRAAMPALLAALEGKETRLRRNAAGQLTVMFEAVGKDDLAALQARLKDEDVQVRADVARVLWLKGQTDRPVLDALTDAVKSGSPRVRTNILTTIQNAPARPKALVPLLEESVKTPVTHEKIQSARLLYQVEKKPGRVLPIYLAILKDSDSRYSWPAALTALGDLGPDGKSAIPRLVEMMKLKDFYNVYEVRAALVRMEEPAVAPMVELLRDMTAPNTSNPPQENAVLVLAQLGEKAVKEVLPLLDARQTQVRLRAVRVLGMMFPPPKDSIPKLTELLEDREVALREQAASALGNMGQDAKAAIPKLTDLAKNKDSPQPRVAAMRALVRIGAPAKSLIPIALAGLKDGDPQTKSAALDLLQSADPKHEDLLDKARELLKDNATRHAAMQALVRMGDGAAGAVPDLVKQLGDPSDYTRRSAADTLGQMGPVAREAGPALAATLRRADPQLHNSALFALSRINPDPKPVVPKLLDFVKDPKNRNHGAVAAAMQTLGGFGPKAADAGPVLLAVLKDGTHPTYHRAVAGLALAQVDPALAKKEGFAPLRAMLRADPNNLSPARAILLADPQDRAAVAAFETHLKSTNQVTRANAAQAIAAMGREGKPFAPLLRGLLKDQYYYSRGWGALALYRVTGDAREVLPTLEKMLANDREAYARGYAAYMLGEMGAAAKPAWKALLALRNDRDPYPRQQANQALRKIDPAAAPKAGVW